MVPLLIVIFAGGLWVWGSIANRNLDQAVSASVERAAHSVCGQTPMPTELIWLIPSLKSDLITSIRPWCPTDDGQHGPLAAMTTRGDIEGASGQASHAVTVTAGGKPIVQLRVRSESADSITVIGWSTP